MQLTPRYDDPGYLSLDLPLDSVTVPLVRQVERLASVLAGLDDEQWAAPSRCDGWSVQDVIVHLSTACQFFAFSIRSALAGEPTRFLATFDPVASPAELVAGTRSKPPAEVLEGFVAAGRDLVAVVGDLDEAQLAVLAEAPPGHIPVAGVVLHSLWDSWTHERDVMLPLGLAPAEEPDEIVGGLAYVAALSPAFFVATGAGRSGAIAIEATGPDVHLVVEVSPGSVAVHGGDAPDGALVLSGPAVDLLEGLTFRAPLPCPVPDEKAWLLSGLATVFDRPA